MSELARFNPRHLRLVERQLVPNEQIGWIGRPSIVFYTLQDLRGLIWIPLSLEVVVGILRLTSNGKSGIANREQVISGLFATGLGILGIMIAVNVLYARRTIYAVTNRRAMILEPYFAGLGPRATQSYGYAVMGVIECQPLFSGVVGNVIFKHEHIGFKGGLVDTRQRESVVDQIGFLAVRDACRLAEAMSQYIYVR